MSLNEHSTVTLTMSQIYKVFAFLGGLVVVALGGIWTIAHFALGGVNESVRNLQADVAAISKAVSALDRGGINELRNTEVRLTQQMGALREQIGAFTVKVEAVEKSFSGVANQMSDVQKALAQRVEGDPGWGLPSVN